MKRLVGGDYLLDLTPIEIKKSIDGETYTNITNAEVLEQLTNLKKFINNPEMVKPVWVKLVNGETDELIVVRGQFKVVDSDEFEIDIQLDGYHLKIHIKFTQATLPDNTPIDDWYIDTNDAKFIFTSDAQSLAQQLADFTGDVAITGDVAVTGDTKVFENIVDKDGHPRFIEGDIGIDTIEGVTKTYGKWSLSGSHLLFVLAIQIAETTVINGKISSISLPAWIFDKIINLAGALVDQKTIQVFNNVGASTQNLIVQLQKVGNDIQIHCASLTASTDRYGRIIFDLLIDNE